MTAGDAEVRYTCPCCGYRMFTEPPGSYEVCPICFWEDDEVQLRFPFLAGGANHVSLREAQGNFAAFGACEERFRDEVSAPGDGDVRDLDWRPLTAADCADMAGAPTTGMEYFLWAMAETEVRYYWERRKG